MPRPCKLTFDLLTLKVVSKSCVTWPIHVPILVFLGLSVVDFMDAGMGGAGWASAHPGKIRVGMAHPGNFSHGLKTSWQ